MDNPQESAPKGHARTRSGVKATRPRSSTKGPLDVNDAPLASPLSLPPQRLLSPTGQPRSRTPTSTTPFPPSSPARSPMPTTTRRLTTTTLPARPRERDFSYLLRPEIYHPLTNLNTPPAFRTGPHQPSPDTPLPDLLTAGHFRGAAIAAAQALTAAAGTSPGPIDPADHARIFDLLYTRLACLTLLDGGTALAAHEVKALGDLSSAFYYAVQDDAAHLVPWDLRVLCVRLQALGFGDPRRAVMSYYELAREARAAVAAAAGRHDHGGMEVWKARLGDLGVRVAGALVEMGDLMGAAAHLWGLRPASGGGMREALLWLHLGDFEAALGKWRALREVVEDEMVGVNEAVCLLYVGKMQEGRALLESLVDSGRSSHTLLFNLTTMYELCTDRSRALKVKLSEKVAAMGERADGWEKTNADFKL
ncbi:hypothetical protein BT67DRAFT_462123 [Trichocladium antarcticum]|uniref:Trafficking protein particle complex subunit 12 n=1 Tax=Trichocladium antarcticum TaxID=1450529 RepID=A0AAN6UKU8_9PEZI|nr:hypothetical protein BT67DRAFT_462123 [Trichocladium antarcticum]